MRKAHDKKNNTINFGTLNSLDHHNETYRIHVRQVIAFEIQFERQFKVVSANTFFSHSICLSPTLISSAFSTLNLHLI